MKDAWGPQPIDGEVEKQLEEAKLQNELSRLQELPDPELDVEPKTTTLDYPPGQRTIVPTIGNLPIRFEAFLDFKKGLPPANGFYKIYYEQIQQSTFLEKSLDNLSAEFPAMYKRLADLTLARKSARMLEEQMRERGGWRSNPRPYTNPEDLAQARYLFARSLRFLAKVAVRLDAAADPTDFVR